MMVLTRATAYFHGKWRKTEQKKPETFISKENLTSRKTWLKLSQREILMLALASLGVYVNSLLSRTFSTWATNVIKKVNADGVELIFRGCDYTVYKFTQHNQPS